VTVVPDPPHTNMFHTVLPWPPDEAMARAAKVAASDQVALFRRVRGPGAREGTSVVETTICSAAAAISDDELAALFDKLSAS
jgi:hypothetical protein